MIPRWNCFRRGHTFPYVAGFRVIETVRCASCWSNLRRQSRVVFRTSPACVHLRANVARACALFRTQWAVSLCGSQAGWQCCMYCRNVTTSLVAMLQEKNAYDVHIRICAQRNWYINPKDYFFINTWLYEKDFSKDFLIHTWLGKVIFLMM